MQPGRVAIINKSNGNVSIFCNRNYGLSVFIFLFSYFSFSEYCIFYVFNLILYSSFNHFRSRIYMKLKNDKNCLLVDVIEVLMSKTFISYNLLLFHGFLDFDL